MDIDKQIIDEWRDLGFFYDLKKNKRQWIIRSSLAGATKFTELLDEYAANPKHKGKSEHEHYGPYSYLEIMTWPEPGMDDHSIHGTLSDIRKLSELIKDKLPTAKPGSNIVIQKEYSDTSAYSLVIEIQTDDFDPATADENMKEKLANKAL